MNEKITLAERAAKRKATVEKRRAELRKAMARNVKLMNTIVRKKVAAGAK